MEIFFKVLYSFFMLAIAVALVTSAILVWRSQVDLKQTFMRWFRKVPPGQDVIAIRDPNTIYQDGVPVGVVTGAVERVDETVIFRQLSDTTRLKQDLPFQYQRQTLQIVRKAIIGIKIGITPTGSEVKTAVLEDVVCRKAD